MKSLVEEGSIVSKLSSKAWMFLWQKYPKYAWEGKVQLTE